MSDLITLSKKQVIRTCVLCRKKELKHKLLQFLVFKEKVYLPVEKSCLGRSFYFHPKCLSSNKSDGGKKLRGCFEYQLKRFGCSFKEHSFLLDDLSDYLKQRLAEMSSSLGFRKKNIEEALFFLNKKKASKRFDLTNKSEAANKKIRL